MRKLTTSAGAGILVALIALISLVLLHQPFSGDTALAGHGATAGTVDHVALDTDQTGNAPPGAGTIASPYACFTSGGIKVPATTTVQTTVDQPTIGSTVKIDVVVDQIDISDRVQSYQFIVNYPDQGNALGTAATVLSGGPPSFIPTPMIAANDVSNPTPASPGYQNTTSEVKVSVSDVGNTPGECGSGVLATLTFTCLKAGISDLTLSAVILVPDGGVSGSNLVDGAGTGTTTLGGATVTCGSAFDPEALTAVTVAPGTETAGTAFNVTVDGTVVNNGPTQPANTDVEVTLNMPSDCTATGGPTKTIQDQSLTATASPIPQQTFSVTCTDPSDHSFTATIETILDDASGADTNLGNNTATSAASPTAVTATADVAVVSVSADAPANAATGTPFPVTADVTVSNLSGVDPVDVDTTITLMLPGDCSTGDTNPVIDQNRSVSQAGSPVSIPQQSWSVTCTNTSAHTFTVDAAVAVDQTHVSDPAGGNDTATSPAAIVAISAAMDPEALTALTTAPATGTAGTAFDVTVDGTVKNNGPTQPANTDVKVTLNLPSDCTATGGPTKTIQDQSLTATASAIPQQTFSVTCTDPSDHSFTATIETILDDTNGVDTNSGNNTANSAASVTAVTADADVEVTSVSASAPASAGTGVPFTVTADVTVSNLSGVDPVSVDTTITLTLPGDCSTGDTNPVTVQNTSVSQAGSPVSIPQESWSVTCTSSSPSDHTFTVDAAVAVDQTHVSDTAGGNDTDSGQAIVAIFPDADSDGVADNVDNCPNTPANETVDADGCSASQLDTDGDGVSDAADLCPNTPANETVDADGCSASQLDTDGDGVSDAADNCPSVANAGQTDTDGDGDGDACDTDDDGDGVSDLDEEKFGSGVLDASSTPEDAAFDPATCSDGVDNDGDGDIDTADSGCVSALPPTGAMPPSGHGGTTIIAIIIGGLVAVAGALQIRRRIS